VVTGTVREKIPGEEVGIESKMWNVIKAACLALTCLVKQVKGCRSPTFVLTSTAILQHRSDASH
jgi:hypothetical protein